MAHSIQILPWLPSPRDDFSARCRAVAAGVPPAGDTIRALAGHRLDAQQSLALARAIARCRTSGGDLAPLSGFRLGVLASATFDLVADCIPAAAARHGVAVEIVTTPYDQVIQQALDPSSDINRAVVDAVLIAVDHRWFKLDRPAFGGDDAGHVADGIARLTAVIGALRSHGGAASIVQTLAMPPQALFGNYDRRMQASVRAMIDEANRQIVSLAEETGSYLFDVAAIAERVGTDQWFDPVHWVSYKLPFSAECVPLYSEMLGRILGAIRGKARKCLVLDLDNTVWGGVIGDDGIEGIVIGQGNARGEAHLSVQQCALDLRGRGIVLAVASKNTDDVARAPFRDHPEMLLRENHFAVFQANWLDKPTNLEAIAGALNIGLDALVVLDDNPAERAQIRAALPMVAVPELPSDPSWFTWYLTAAGYFEAVSYSAEDAGRADSYAGDARRAEVMATSRDLGDYLSSLQMTIGFAPFDKTGRARIAQLINKTNQFNLTTRRYTEAEVAAMEADPAVFTLQVRLGDKFGDLGMIGVVICRPAAGDTEAWEIDTWLMSCRVLGRRVEDAMLARVMAAARKRGVKRLLGTYIPTAKNGMVAEFYPKLGFGPVCQSGDESRFVRHVADVDFGSLPFSVADRGKPDENIR